MAFGATGIQNIRKFGAALLASTALAAMPSVSFAQTVIDGNNEVSVPGHHLSPWDLFGTVLRVGDTTGSDATLNIGVSGVGAGEVTNAGATVGFEEDSKGTVNVTGGGSLWTSTGSFYVGREGEGTVDVSDGAHLETDATADIGLFGTGKGTVIIQGAGSKWIAGNHTFIGNQGIGVVRVENGGTVSVDGNVLIGQVLGGNGLVVVTGEDSTLTSAAGIRVGNGAAGSDPSGQLRIEDRGSASASEVIIGYGSDANGVLTVSGAGSELRVGGGGFIVGRAGTGMFILDDGATLTSNMSGGAGLQIGSANGSRGTATISNGAHWNAGTRNVRIANEGGSEGVLNIGGGVDASGNPLAATGAGTLTASTVIFSLGDGHLNFNHTDAAYIFSPEITGGSGTINHFAGTTTIANMEFFDGDVNVFGGRLGGTGSPGSTTGTLTVQDGGTLTPGNSIGTFAVASATFNSGSILEIEINNGGNVAGTNNDRVVAATATVADGATFHVVPENGTDDGTTYAPNTQYTIIETATPGALTVTGTQTITDTFAFLDFTGHADTQNYYLTSSAVASSFCLPGASFNQCQTGEAVNALGAGNVLYDTATGFSAAQARAAFDLASGEIHASGQHVINQTFELFSRTLRQQGIAGAGEAANGGSQTSAPLGYVSSAPRPAGVAAIDGATASADVAGQYAWVAPLGARGNILGNGNAAGLDWWSLGLAGGYESVIDLGSGDAVAGLAVGYLRGGGEAAARLSTLETNGLHLGAYGGWTDGAWALAGSLSYAADHVSTSRRIAFGALNPTAEASYWNHTLGLSTEFSYAFAMGDGFTVAPLVTLDAGWSGHGGYTETGAGALNLTAAGRSMGWLDAGLGLSLAHTVETESGSMTFEGKAIWEHAIADVAPAASHMFAGGAAALTVNGPDAARDRLRLGAGLAFEIGDDLTIRASYDGLLSGSQQSHAGSVGLNVKF